MYKSSVYRHGCVCKNASILDSFFPPPLAYSKVFGAIAAPFFLGLSSHTINQNSQEIMAITFSHHIYFPSAPTACDQVRLSHFSCILGKIFMFKCFLYVFLLVSSLLFCLICFTILKFIPNSSFK